MDRALESSQRVPRKKLKLGVAQGAGGARKGLLGSLSRSFSRQVAPREERTARYEEALDGHARASFLPRPDTGTQQLYPSQAARHTSQRSNWVVRISWQPVLLQNVPSAVKTGLGG